MKINKNLINELDQSGLHDERNAPLLLYLVDQSKYDNSPFENEKISVIEVSRHGSTFMSKSYTYFKPISKLF